MRSEVMSVSSVRLFRQALGALLLLAGTALLAARGLAWLDLAPRMLRALEGGALCALGTALGAVPVLVIRNMPVALADTLLGFGAGVMLAATAFSLIMPGLDAAQAIGFSPWGAGGLISFGLMFGALCLFLIDLKVSNASPQALVGSAQQPVIAARIWLFVIAIIAHNIPEGMAIGVSAGGGMADADSLAMGIALQDVPEGLVIALVLAGAGMPRFKAFMIGAASGLVEPVA
ncbi:ZIP family metal transporter, partial [Pseudomonas juntendi]